MQYDGLVARLAGALERGDVEPAAVERLLRRSAARGSGPDVPGVLRAAGMLVCFTGAALLYGVEFGAFPHAVRLLTPFLFPAVALGGAIAMRRGGRPAWEVELAGMVGYVALAAAFLASGAAAGAGTRAGVVASLAATGVVLVMHTAVRIVRLTSWGLSASLVALTGFAADVAGILNGSTAPWWLALQALAAAGVGALLLGRGSREGGAGAWRSASLLAVVASIAGLVHAGAGQLGPWQVLLGLAVAATLVAAARFDMSGVMWTGAAGSVVWIAELAILVGRSASWAVAVMLVGLGLVAIAALVARPRRRLSGSGL
jgi:hypothetical protein